MEKSVRLHVVGISKLQACVANATPMPPVYVNKVLLAAFMLTRCVIWDHWAFSGQGEVTMTKPTWSAEFTVAH